MKAFAGRGGFLANSQKIFPGGRIEPFALYLPLQSAGREKTMNRSLIAVCLFVLFVASDGVVLAAEPADIAAQRSRLQLASVPQEPSSVLATLQQLKGEKSQTGDSASQEVTVVGQVGGMPNPFAETHPDFPFFAGQASFFLLDSKIANQFAHHAKHHGGSHNCAFCQRLAAKSAHTIAVVNFVDENGEILKIDSRELLGLEENQRIIIRGRAELLGGTMLVIHADGAHIRR